MQHTPPQAASMAGEPAAMRKPYQPPTLTLFGQVATLTRAVTCSANNDGNGACVAGTVGGNMGKSSDRRLKQDIVRVGDHPAGFGLYLFRYKPEHRDTCGHGRHFGVMADEVQPLFPEAVLTQASGFQAVRYDLLGIRSDLH